jgi:hypothetical protein
VTGRRLEPQHQKSTALKPEYCGRSFLSIALRGLRGKALKFPKISLVSRSDKSNMKMQIIGSRAEKY